jgi:hypothetical protein
MLQENTLRIRQSFDELNDKYQLERIASIKRMEKMRKMKVLYDEKMKKLAASLELKKSEAMNSSRHSKTHPSSEVSGKSAGDEVNDEELNKFLHLMTMKEDFEKDDAEQDF